MKYATRLISLTVTLIIGGLIYLYFSGFFDEAAFAVFNADENKYELKEVGFEMLTSSIIWIPTLCAFLFGLFFNSVGYSIAVFAYNTDENDQIKKYKDWYEREKTENEEQLNEQQSIAKNARSVAENSVKIEKNNLVKTKEYLESLISNNQAKQAELNQKISDYNAAKEHFESSKENLDTQRAEFNSKRKTENKAFHRASAKRDRKNNALVKWEYQYSQSQRYIRALKDKIAELESNMEH